MKPRIFFLLAAIALLGSAMAAPPVEEGRVIFSARCASCHNVSKTLTGPALAGVDERHNIDWIVKFVQSSQTLVKQGDAQAVALFDKFNRIPMPDHRDLSESQIKNIVEFVKAEAKSGGEKAPFARPAKLRPNYLPVSVTNPGFFVAYGVLVVLLIAALLFAVQVKEYERGHAGID